MSHFKMSYQDFIQSSFSPLVAVMCSPLVDQICKKNNLSFTEMIQPFCKLNSEASFRDPSGVMISIKNLRINVSDVNSRPPQPTMARKFLNESVSCHINDRTTTLDVGGINLQVPVSVPWFEAWRDTFLQVQFPSDHEFTKHYVACMLVVSSRETSPLDMFVQMGSQLQQMQTISPAKLPKWFSPAVLRYHILLHDNTEGDTPLAESLFETMKTTYGVNNVFFLSINSQQASTSETHMPDPWSQFLTRQLQSQSIAVDGVMTNSWSSSTTSTVHGSCLTADDVEKLRELVTCFCLSCLVPHVEQQIQHLTELISNKKGMSRSFLSATKRWFGSKPGVPNTPTPTITYTTDSTELQLRRLGDLCFMFGAYSLAFTAYHAAKRDFNADGAWLYYAGALEMAALSLFMQAADSTKKAHDYAEESIMTYLNSCRYGYIQYASLLILS
ncbi:trafficking protein particle complex subunit 8 isoform X2 [Homalodisca vitripennis]|uniref:trafficking protein particle complex subunit 8 isoform X2 n=1 Tax=Homalodisca vitripennis TaxID=197043 RepID=UPI001EEA6913|nr:trafficking protein particle complex subunit 8 isoform X2 [Homalodisca vitripennis]